MRLRTAVAGGLVALALTVVVGGAALAQSRTPTPIAAATERAQAFVDALATKLGIPADRLSTAIIEVGREQIQADLTAGRITQDEADRLNERLDQDGALGVIGHGRKGPGHKGRGGHHGPGGFGIGDVESLATFLGTDVETLGTELRSGKSLAQVAVDHGKSRDDLKAYLTNEAKLKLDTAVADGRLTRAEADARLTELSSRLDTLIDSTAGPGRHHRGDDSNEHEDRAGDPGSPPATTPVPTVQPTSA